MFEKIVNTLKENSSLVKKVGVGLGVVAGAVVVSVVLKKYGIFEADESSVEEIMPDSNVP